MKALVFVIGLIVLSADAALGADTQESAVRSDDWLQFWNNKADRKDRLVAVSYVMGFFDAFRGLGMVCRAPVSYESLASVTADIIRTTEEKELMIAVALAHERLGCRFPGKGGAK